MKKGLKIITSCLVLLGFGMLLSAQPATYSFSAFGGGLPSSAMMAADSETETIDQELTDITKKEKEPMSSKKKAIIITASVVGGLLVIGGIAVGCYFLKAQVTKCCENATQDCAESFTSSLTESCQNGSLTTLTESLIYVP